MNELRFFLTLDMHAFRSQATVRVKRGDTKNKLIIRFSEYGRPYILPPGAYAVFTSKKPDENKIFNDCTIEGNAVVYTLTAQTTALEGVLECEIQLFDINNNLLTSPAFTVEVDSTIVSPGEIISTSEYNALTHLMSDVNRLLITGEIKGNTGIYVGDGDMPEDCWLQINPFGEAMDLSTYATVEEAKAFADSKDSAISEALNAGTAAHEAANEAHEAADTAQSTAESAQSSIDAHAQDKTNPHKVTAEQTGAEVEGTAAELDKELNASLSVKLAVMEGQIADLMYKAIAVNSFTCSVTTAEIGSTVTNPVLTWSLNKKPASLMVADRVVSAVQSGSKTMTESITANRKYTIEATDERDAVATKEVSISFLNGVYYGVASEPSAYDSAFVLGLTKTLRSSKLPSFNVTAGDGQYIYYCLPTRLGTCKFTVGGFTGGFTLIDTIAFTNASGYTENYYIYRSDNAGLGATAVGVS